MFAISNINANKLYDMVFYFTPPKGNIQLQNFETNVENRWLIFLQLLECDDDHSEQVKSILNSITFFEQTSCVQANSPYDRISHFALRMRLKSATKHEIENIARQLYQWYNRYSSVVCNNDENKQLFYESIKILINGIISLDKKQFPNNEKPCLIEKEFYRRLVHLTFINDDHYTEFNSNIQYIKVPFIEVLDLISQRLIYIHLSYGYVPITKAKWILIWLFRKHLQFNRKNIEQFHIIIKNDPRLILLKQKLKQKFYNKINSKTLSSINMHSIHLVNTMKFFDEQFINLYPPCMKHLHEALVRKHRLTNYSRVVYTLYLKEIGVPLERCIELFEKEYSTTSCHSSCNHSWHNDSKRYKYSIRHLYGLEGSKINYSSHRCRTIQDDSSRTTRDELACPLIHFQTQNELNQLMSNEFTDDIFKLRSTTSPSTICCIYQQKLQKKFLSEHETKQTSSSSSSSSSITNDFDINKNTILRPSDFFRNLYQCHIDQVKK
ncbi:unnamed protein product [Didymodactylos carnosus]|uniref:DNA primase large subunit C-terminal domain-containing protein n=1 Tax=Didymodactylos carnosus TaxID=1234261 RepID=A0A813UYB8_9BILA|nr:unnamed protein product [Didymodactylos carnosus]CAF3616788.1 unnamed protein product [Didymodactylos carnosus]